jgi:collagenase-like PrtC family protease
MITTFASSPEQVLAALSAGADHLIIEHSRLTIRSFHNDESDLAFGKYSTLSALSQSILPTVKRSISIDILPHNEDLPVIESAIHAAIRSDIHAFRIQDIGVASLIREIDPSAEITLAPEIGYHSAKSIRIALRQVDRLSVSNEVSVSTLRALADCSDRLEIQVQGPIMIQYSYRRYLDGVIHNASTYDRQVSDTEYPGRLVRFFDSPNGTIMFLYFDRCLLREWTHLNELKLGTWLVDCRGESSDYLTTAISTYRQIEDDQPVDIPTIVSTLHQLSGRPQRPGFFLQNNTDQDRDRPLANRDVLAVVRDAVKGKYLMVEFRESIPALPSHFSIITSKGEYKDVTQLEFKDPISLQVVVSASTGDLLLTQWISGVAPKSMLLSRF